MVLSELLLQPSLPSHTYFHSNLDHYDPKMKFYENNHHELSSSVTTTHENSSSVSSVNFPMLSNDSSYDHDDMHNPSLVNIEGLNDVCRWLCHDDDDYDYDDDQRMEDVSICVQDDDDSTEIDSQTGIKNLLMAYAEAMEMEQEELAKVIVKCISEKANPNGSSLERIAFNLFQPAHSQDKAYLFQESLRNFKPAFRAFYDIFPYARFAHLTACSAILEAVPTHVHTVHIIDFDISEGIQWPPVMEAIARIKKSLIITSIKLDQDQYQDSQFDQTKIHLCNFARRFGLKLKVQEMGMPEMMKTMEDRKLGSEFMAFNCMIGLPHMGRTRTTPQVMEFMKLAKGFLAKTEGIITFGNGEGERTPNYLAFSSFFNKNLTHYKALYESMEWGFPSYLNEGRIAMETLFLAPFVSSKSWFRKWEERCANMVFDPSFLTGFGLKGKRMSWESWNEAMEMVKEGETPYRIGIEGENGNEMVLKWKETPLVRICAWKSIT